jgi:hypothetical protein
VQIPALTGNQVQQLTTTLLAAMTPAQLNAFTVQQVQLLPS